jgi:hypothetical protein
LPEVKRGTGRQDKQFKAELFEAILYGLEIYSSSRFMQNRDLMKPGDRPDRSTQSGKQVRREAIVTGGSKKKLVLIRFLFIGRLKSSKSAQGAKFK